MGARINSCLLPFFFLLFFTFNIPLLYGADDTITTTQFLTGDQTLVSSGENYELGFFKTKGNSFNYYIGMWYKKVSFQTIIWVANRDTPVDKFSSQLKIIDGNLVLLDGLNTLIWSTNITDPSSSNSTVAVLRDDGNLVLIDGLDSNPSWESFNHPTHTFFPGTKIGYNKLTKRKIMLSSWKNYEDPGIGLFSLELDPDGRQYIIRYNGSVSSWTSGDWDGRTFSNIPEMRLNNILNYSYTDNEKETYFTYSLYNDLILSRFVLDITGQEKMFLWTKDAQQWNLSWSHPRRCDSYASCGVFSVCDDNSNPYCNCLIDFMPTPGLANDTSGGCVRRANLECGNENKISFRLISNMGLPESPQSVAVGSVQECRTNCSSNCSCTAYTYNNNGCFIWNSVLQNLRTDRHNTSRNVFYIKLSSSELSKAKSKVVIGIIVGCVLGVVGLSGLACFVTMRRKRNLGRSTKVVEGPLVVFDYRDLKRATKNFSEKIGGGGFGSVFKGRLYEEDSNSIVAVKRLEGISQGEKQFRAEVSTIGKIQHVNLVRLHGFCSDKNKKLLVYEYMQNGSLNSHLFTKNQSKVLHWERRYKIALGIARGLAYLHEKCRDCIIHCDIKPENILLDAELCPKVADFGLAKVFGHEFSKVLTTIRGTRGYLAPEWISGVAITTKADVYSYGMMLFELVSGRRNTERPADSELTFFPTEAANVTIGEGDILSLLDLTLGRIADIEEVRKMCRVACWCVQDEENLRPSMGQVVQILEGVLDVKLPQIPRSLQLFADDQEEHVRFFSDPLLSPSSDEVLPLNASY